MFPARECREQSGHLVRSCMELSMSSVLIEALVLMGVAVMYLFDALQLRL